MKTTATETNIYIVMVMMIMNDMSNGSGGLFRLTERLRDREKNCTHPPIEINCIHTPILCYKYNTRFIRINHDLSH